MNAFVLYVPDIIEIGTWCELNKNVLIPFRVPFDDDDINAALHIDDIIIFVWFMRVTNDSYLMDIKIMTELVARMEVRIDNVDDYKINRLELFNRQQEDMDEVISFCLDAIIRASYYYFYHKEHFRHRVRLLVLDDENEYCYEHTLKEKIQTFKEHEFVINKNKEAYGVLK